MAIVKVTSTAFNPQTKCIKDFLSGNTTAFYIPNYQRGYSWRKENIEQLQTDIEEGLTRLINEPTIDEVRFLGTIITIQLLDPLITKPSPTYTVIDGQQRLTTISILSCLILHRLNNIVKKLKSLDTKGQLTLNYTEIDTVYGVWKDCLMKAISTDFYPAHRPKIIREGQDKWDNTSPKKGLYSSPLATYLYTFIDAFKNDSLPANRITSPDKILNDNMSILWRWIDKICAAHKNGLTYSADKFLGAALWKYGMPPIQDLDIVVNNYALAPKNGSESDLACQFVQLLSACNYLFDACCFTVIDCSQEDWAFDLFQSLNATGTPLTVIETFKPLVVNTINASSTPYSGSISEQGFTDVESLFDGVDTAERKNSITQSLITSFFVSYNGDTISSHFSNQRRALVSSYKALSTLSEQENFIQYLGHFSLFYKIWQNPEPAQFSFLAGKPETALIQMLILFLKDSNHKMATTVLGRFYHEILLQPIATSAYSDAVDEFIQVVKIMASFYFFWRSAFNNAGLDDVYRRFFNANNFFTSKITSSDVKAYFQNEMIKKLSSLGASHKSAWESKSFTKLNKEDAGNHICRLALLAQLHDTVDGIGVVNIGTAGIRLFLDRKNWEEAQLKTIEHIAPQSASTGTWDPNIYTPNSIVHSIGNLTLLPQEINSAAGNNDWTTKCGLYQYIGAPTPVAIAHLNTMYGANLSPKTKTILTDSNRRHIPHLTHITNNETDPSGTKKWGKIEIDNRTQNIIDMAWDRFSPWLF